MPKADLIARLQQEILPLQGYKSALQHTALDVGLGAIKNAFPGGAFPLGAIHEFFCDSAEDLTASSGFIAGIVAALIKKNGAVIWIGSAPKIFPPALKAFGIEPHQLIFVHLKKERELLWAMEEALKCSSLAAVVGEISDITFTGSRRLQLAVENSGVTCFLLRYQPRNLTTAFISRWRITHVASAAEEGLPGLGHPRWQVELLKVRNGVPGAWQLEWKGGQFKQVYKTISVAAAEKRKTG